MSQMLLASTQRPKFDSLPPTSVLRQRQTRPQTHTSTQAQGTVAAVEKTVTDADSSPHSLAQKSTQVNNAVAAVEKTVADAASSLHSLARDYTPYPKILESISYRLQAFFICWTFKVLGELWIKYHLAFNPQPTHTRPNLTRRYPVRPNLNVDIFFPPTYDASSDESALDRRLYPLYLSLHGGGLVVGNSALNHTSDRSWSDRTNSLVVSLNYSKSPFAPFPTAAHDVAELAAAVIADTSLPIDRSRVTIGGFSAGALLSLSATQLFPLRGKVQAAVAYYPCVDFSEYPQAKYEKRLDKTKSFESLNLVAFALDWAYVSVNHDRRDRVLSPWYADHDDLPENICIVGCQYDLFCREGRDMIYQLAGREIRTDEGHENEWKEDWEEGRHKWMFAEDMPHAFTEEVGRTKGNGAWDQKRDKYCEYMFEDVYQWLNRRQCV